MRVVWALWHTMSPIWCELHLKRHESKSSSSVQIPKQGQLLLNMSLWWKESSHVSTFLWGICFPMFETLNHNITSKTSQNQSHQDQHHKKWSGNPSFHVTTCTHRIVLYSSCTPRCSSRLKLFLLWCPLSISLGRQLMAASLLGPVRPAWELFLCPNRKQPQRIINLKYKLQAKHVVFFPTPYG